MPLLPISRYLVVTPMRHQCSARGAPPPVPCDACYGPCTTPATPGGFPKPYPGGRIQQWRRSVGRPVGSSAWARTAAHCLPTLGHVSRNPCKGRHRICGTTRYQPPHHTPAAVVCSLEKEPLRVWHATIAPSKLRSHPLQHPHQQCNMLYTTGTRTTPAPPHQGLRDGRDGEGGVVREGARQ